MKITELYDKLTLRRHYREKFATYYHEEFVAAVKHYLENKNLKVTKTNELVIKDSTFTEPLVVFASQALITGNHINGGFNFVDDQQSEGVAE